MIKRMIAVAALAALGATNAFAADPLYTTAAFAKASPMAGANSWSGWYAGLNAGYVDSSSNVNADAVVTANSTTPRTAPAMVSGATG